MTGGEGRRECVLALFGFATCVHCEMQSVNEAYDTPFVLEKEEQMKVRLRNVSQCQGSHRVHKARGTARLHSY